jgi:hypothetical protein
LEVLVVAVVAMRIIDIVGTFLPFALILVDARLRDCGHHREFARRGI